MENNEDIKILEEFINNYKEVQEKYKDDEIQAEIERSCYFEEVPAKAIENLLSRLKTAERMIELMAEQFEIMKDKEEEIDCFIPREYSDIDDCVKKDSCQECIIEYFRNKAKESK